MFRGGGCISRQGCISRADVGGDGGFFSIIDFFSSASSSGLQRCSFLWILIDNSDALTECKPIQFCSFSSHDLIIGVRRSLRALQHQQPGLASAHIVDACWHPCAVGSKHSNAGCGECVMHHPRREPEPDKSGSVVMHVFFFFFFSCFLVCFVIWKRRSSQVFGSSAVQLRLGEQHAALWLGGLSAVA